MANLISINSLLSTAARLLDQAASEIKEVDLQSRKDHIDSIGKALVEIFELQKFIYTIEPSLRPAFLEEENPNKESDTCLTQCMEKALRLEDSGEIVLAISEYEEYIAIEDSALHKEIAEGQLKRLRAGGL